MPAEGNVEKNEKLPSLPPFFSPLAFPLLAFSLPLLQPTPPPLLESVLNSESFNLTKKQDTFENPFEGLSLSRRSQ